MPPKRTSAAAAATGTTRRSPATSQAASSKPTASVLTTLSTTLVAAESADDLEDDTEMLATLHALTAKRAKARTQKAQQVLDKIGASVDAARTAGDEQVDRCVEEARRQVARVERECEERAEEVRARMRGEVGETDKMLKLVKETMAMIVESRRESQLNYEKMWDSMIQTLVGPEHMLRLHTQTVESLTARSTAAAQELRLAAIHAAEASVGKVHEAYEIVQRMDPAAGAAGAGRQR